MDAIDKQTQLFIDAKSRFEGYLILKYGTARSAKGVDCGIWELLQYITERYRYGRDKPDC